MIIYIKKSVKGIYVSLDQELDSELYNDIGTDWNDYQQNKYVKLSDEQIQFHIDNPSASISEVWNCSINVENPRTLSMAKQEMIQKIENYDISNNVNSFVVNGVSTWFTPLERSNYKQSIDAAKLAGIESLSLFIENKLITIPTTVAEHLLAQIQLYADQCFIVTKQHKLAIENLDNIPAVDSYDYTTSYPEKLNFAI